MNFLRNRLVVLVLVLAATLLLYLLLPSIRQGSMEPSLEAQRMGLMATSSPPLTNINVTVRTGQLPGDPPLFFREALPVDTAGKQILPRWFIFLNFIKKNSHTVDSCQNASFYICDYRRNKTELWLCVGYKWFCCMVKPLPPKPGKTSVQWPCWQPMGIRLWPWICQVERK